MSEEKKSAEERRSANILEEILKTEKEIKKDVKFIKNYFRGQIIWNGVKAVILIGIFVLGIISFNSVISYAKNYIRTFSPPIEATE